MSKKLLAVAFLVAALIVPFFLYRTLLLPTLPAGFAPNDWPKEDLERYMRLQSPDAWKGGELRKSASGAKAMIASTSDPLAIHAGLEALRYGGNAVDAALTTSLAQIALTTGAAVSYAGILTAVYYDASSAKVYTLNAGYNTVKEETDPLSIPAFGSHSGRTALVPGFMAGAQALHDRFGKVPFKKLFEPAIWIAESGVPLSPLVEAWLKQAGQFVTRLPESKRIFTKNSGDFYKVGELFRQPELAASLKKVASTGADYMYRGEWARRFVAAVQREGGKMTMDDLANYQALWTEPAVVDYKGHEIVSVGPPSYGGKLTQWIFSLAAKANFTQHGHYTSSPDSLYWLIQIPREANRIAPQPIPIDKETTHEAWSRIQGGMKAAGEEPRPAGNHSAGVIVVDDQGNVASILHSINGILWGSTGLFVDGISIPDSASLQQGLIGDVGPGKRLPDTTNPLIVLRNGKPLVASAAIGSALHEVTLQNLINILDFGMDIKTSVATSNTQGPYYGTTLTGPPQFQLEMETIAEGAFSPAILAGVRERGQAIKIIPKSDQSQLGYWIGIRINPEDDKLSGAVTPQLPAMVEGIPSGPD